MSDGGVAWRQIRTKLFLLLAMMASWPAIFLGVHWAVGEPMRLNEFELGGIVSVAALEGLRLLHLVLTKLTDPTSSTSGSST